MKGELTIEMKRQADNRSDDEIGQKLDVVAGDSKESEKSDKADEVKADSDTTEQSGE